MVDGNGFLHPRGRSSSSQFLSFISFIKNRIWTCSTLLFEFLLIVPVKACHLGVLCGIPTIGIGKSYLVVDGIPFSKVKDLEKTLKKGGETVNLVGESGTVWGAVCDFRTYLLSNSFSYCVQQTKLQRYQVSISL